MARMMRRAAAYPMHVPSCSGMIGTHMRRSNPAKPRKAGGKNGKRSVSFEKKRSGRIGESSGMNLFAAEEWRAPAAIAPR
jgi:hypothetical protein